MPPVEFEPTIPVFERAKTVHVLDRAATVIGMQSFRTYKNQLDTFHVEVCGRALLMTRRLSLLTTTPKLID
jgi:hypothetical protein